MAERPKKFCRFVSDGRTYCGLQRDAMVDIVDGDPISGITETRMSLPLDRVRLLPPLIPGQIWCVGRNYVGHVKELNHELPTEPVIFLKGQNTIAGYGDAVRMPDWAGRIDYEGELAVVIGKRCRRASEKDALSYVMGYSCFNDVTARELQEQDGQWIRAKSFDGFAPFGPWILLEKELPPQTRLMTRVNNRVVQSDTLSNMIFSVSRIISHISRFATLEPGDIIATGTPEGIGRVNPEDHVTVEIDGIGQLSNPFIAGL